VPALEAEPYAAAAQVAGIDWVMIAAPNTPGQTLTRIAHLSGGYTYCVARTGVTGVRDQLSLEHERLFKELKRLHAPPAILGFGISTPDHVRQAMATGAAGVISGSAIVRLAAETGSPDRVANFVAGMKASTRPFSSERGIRHHAC
jgi:tryptophan synthase alpha chain